MNEKDYKKIIGIESVDIGSKVQLLKQIKKLQRKKGRTEKGFSAMPIKRLRGIYFNLIKTI